MANDLPTEKKVLAISMLAEGSSIRSVERTLSVHRDTVMRLGVRVGQACAKIQDEKMRNIQSTDFQIDEIWGFVGKKRKQTKTWEWQDGIGDVWTFIALARDTKLIPAFWVGQRTVIHAKHFLRDLESRLAHRIQLSTDGLAAYRETAGEVFCDGVDFGQVVRTYSVSHLGNFKVAATRYSPAEVVKTETKIVLGSPDIERISTSHVEKQNHTLRMHCRRLTRLTNAFSKKFENFRAAVALNFAYYNFCKRHITVKMTPAQAAGIESNQWTVAELIERCGE
ncbi:MAG TPA: IS1 family transposase [Candidatus Acidoferrum sp.]|jgi:IS1 family transposase|nr:IS1 family transposase [Candidatus Acidoferrum sp.]